MKNLLIKPIVAGSFIVLLGAIVAGCVPSKGSKPRPMSRYTIEVTLDESLKTKSVIVDLVVVNPSNLPRWEAYDMGNYWKPGDALRHDADKVVLNFVSGQGLTQSMPATDPQWDKWKSQGGTHLLVLADLPPPQASRPGNQDARRQILSLDKKSWPSKTTTLKVLVQRSGIVVLTPARGLR